MPSAPQSVRDVKELVSVILQRMILWDGEDPRILVKKAEDFISRLTKHCTDLENGLEECANGTMILSKETIADMESQKRELDHTLRMAGFITTAFYKWNVEGITFPADLSSASTQQGEA